MPNPHSGVSATLSSPGTDQNRPAPCPPSPSPTPHFCFPALLRRPEHDQMDRMRIPPRPTVHRLGTWKQIRRIVNGDRLQRPRSRRLVVSAEVPADLTPSPKLLRPADGPCGVGQPAEELFRAGSPRALWGPRNCDGDANGCRGRQVNTRRDIGFLILKTTNKNLLRRRARFAGRMRAWPARRRAIGSARVHLLCLLRFDHRTGCPESASRVGHPRKAVVNPRTAAPGERGKAWPVDFGRCWSSSPGGIKITSCATLSIPRPPSGFWRSPTPDRPGSVSKSHWAAGAAPDPISCCCSVDCPL